MNILCEFIYGEFIILVYKYVVGLFTTSYKFNAHNNNYISGKLLG